MQTEFTARSVFTSCPSCCARWAAGRPNIQQRVCFEQVAPRLHLNRVLVVLYFAFCSALEVPYYIVFQRSTVTQQFSYAAESKGYIIIDTIARVINPCIVATLIAVSQEGVLLHSSITRSQVLAPALCLASFSQVWHQDL